MPRVNTRVNIPLGLEEFRGRANGAGAVGILALQLCVYMASIACHGRLFPDLGASFDLLEAHRRVPADSERPLVAPALPLAVHLAVLVPGKVRHGVPVIAGSAAHTRASVQSLIVRVAGSQGPTGRAGRPEPAGRLVLEQCRGRRPDSRHVDKPRLVLLLGEKILFKCRVEVEEAHKGA